MGYMKCSHMLRLHGCFPLVQSWFLGHRRNCCMQLYARLLSAGIKGAGTYKEWSFQVVAHWHIRPPITDFLPRP